MVPAEVTKAAVDAGLSPSVQMIFAIFGIFAIAAAPVLIFIRDWRRRAKLDTAEAHAVKMQTGLYQHLSEQIVLLTTRLDKITDAHNRLVQENAGFKSRVSGLEKYESTAALLENKLSQKDTALLERDRKIERMFVEIRDRDRKIIELQDRVNSLEVRLAQDEVIACRTCRFRIAREDDDESV